MREVVAVAESDQFGATDPRGLIESLKLAAEGILGAVGGGGRGTALELRYVTEPRDDRPTRVRLFITGKTLGDAAPETAVAAAVEMVEAACAALPDGYQWQPVDPADTEPGFDASAALIEVRRQEEVTPPLLPMVPADFYYAAYPLQGDGSGWPQFLALLARSTQPVVVSLLFAPTRLDPLEQETIGVVTSQLRFHAETRQEQNFLGGRRYIQGDANAAAVLPVWEHYLQSLRHCLLVRMTVRGSAGAARAIAKGLAAAISANGEGTGGRRFQLTTQSIRDDHDRRLARHSWVLLDVVPWGGHPFWTDDGAPSTLRRLPYLYSLSEAAAAAVLPVPDDRGAAGFPRARRVTARRMTSRGDQDAHDLLDRDGTSPEIRRLVIEKIEINGGLVVGGDQYNVGQAGAVGPRASARDMTFVQGASSVPPMNDPAVLGAELERLRTHLQADADGSEHDAALKIVAQAELKAKDGDGQAAVEQLSALRRLGNAGRWALTATTTIGTTVAAAALKDALGL
ncbi:MAG: hypothetical protein ACR2H2_13340 [Solirubrobacteraceae bacterium]